MSTDFLQICDSSAVDEYLHRQGVFAKVDLLIGPKPSTKPFGTLLALDFYECPVNSLSSVEIGYQFLDQIATHLGMTMQSPPFVFLSDAQRYPDKAGLSGWVPLIESGISLHTLIPAKFATIDIYSCSSIPLLETIVFACKIFFPQRIEATYIYRGREYYCQQENI